MNIKENKLINNSVKKVKTMNNSKLNKEQKNRVIKYVLASFLLASAGNAYAVYELDAVKTELVDKGWAFLDSITPFIAVGGGLLGAFFARNMDWGMRAAGFGTGTIGFGLAVQGVKAYYGI
jgi:hypothetical protein